VSEGTNRNLPARKTLIQLLALYTDHESHNAARYRQRDGLTDRWHDDANGQSCCVAVRSAKNASSIHYEQIDYNTAAEAKRIGVDMARRLVQYIITTL